MANRIIVNIKSQAKMFFRSKSSVFWTVFFPVVLILLFGAIFSDSGGSTYTLYVQNLDEEAVGSQQFIDALEQTGALKIVEVDTSTDVEQYIKDNSVSALLIIPQGSIDKLINHDPAALELRMDQSSSSANVIFSIVSAVADGVNLEMAGGSPLLTVDTENIVSSQLNYIDFFLPGVIAIMVMQDAVNFVIGTQTRYRTNGIFHKLATTPLTQFEWLISQAVFQLVVVAISVATCLIVGVLAFGIHVNLDIISVAIMVVATMLFSAIGLIIARFIKDEEAAGAAAGAITFPMMFLSGSFFPLEQMPSFLQSLATVLPLTYVNEGLRDAMIFGNSAGAIDNLLILTVLMVVFMAAAVYLTNWKEK
ncbi:ABC transporter permease [Methanomassiliicoccus luminyensis]|uniref:ABC transporter permease n=1 Tax=Methanomassiliicoccus luminyensis TaxID=1080712 RepID=UPI0006748335|nr:ABC transporter permease [Methanomassiliicoccus luminyensis]